MITLFQVEVHPSSREALKLKQLEDSAVQRDRHNWFQQQQAALLEIDNALNFQKASIAEVPKVDVQNRDNRPAPIKKVIKLNNDSSAANHKPQKGFFRYVLRLIACFSILLSFCVEHLFQIPS